MKHRIQVFILIIVAGCCQNLVAQDSYFAIHADSLAKEVPALEHSIDISVSKVDLQEFLRAIANTSSLNMNIDPEIRLSVTNNFQHTTRCLFAILASN